MIVSEKSHQNLSDYFQLFVDHIDQISRKIIKSVGIIYHISSFIPETIHPILYFSLIHFQLSYGISAWGGASDSNLLCLQKLHKRVLKLIPSAASCKILNFSNICKYFSCLKFLKSAKLGHHSYFSQNIHDLQGHFFKFVNFNAV